MFENGDKYLGDFRNGELNGSGTYYYKNGDIYKGEWRFNKKTGFGIQVYTKEGRKYVGQWQDNLYHGEGTLYYADGSYFTGQFLEGDKHGKGVFHDNQEDDYSEEWVGGEMFRRSPVSPTRKNSSSAVTNFTVIKRDSKEKNEELRSRKKERAKTHKQEDEDDDDIIMKSSPKSEGNMDMDKDEATTSDKENLYTNNLDKDYDEQKLHSNILFKSQNDFDSSEGKVYDVGFETLNVIEHMEMLNSVAGTLLNKDVQDWTFQEVGEWLKHLGLNDYIDKFKENHINGEVLFEITEADLKDEFGMHSLGHRKNFMKAIENLKRIYNDADGKNSDYIRHKIQKFYEKNRPNQRSLLNGLRPREGRFYSHRFLSRNTYNSQQEIIEEDDELKHETGPSPQAFPKKADLKDEFKLDHHPNKHLSPTKRTECDADDEEQERSMEECDEIKVNNEHQIRVHGSKRTLSKISSDTPKSSPMKGEPEGFKEDHALGAVEISEEAKGENLTPSRKITGENKGEKESSTNTHEGSSSETSTDSEPSDEEKQKKEALPVVENALKVSRVQSKYEKKASKKVIAPKEHNFKSAELPTISKTSSKKYHAKDKKKGKTATNDRDKLNEKIKDEILRIFKESGLNENFIIDYNELSFDKKIGEGGYGRVFLGKFSGIDVAIKEYGKTKLDIKRAEDFVKEIEVISNLRHPNIVLCMGACIHNGKYLMITEYLEEGSLFDHLHKLHTKISDETMFNIIEDIALGMCYLHGRKVFHCDLKSSNILIDSSWSVKLCDFGLSRVKYKSDRKRFQKQRVGTPHWMAPEILRGEKYDESADVYSFGMILWELMSGEIPYCNMPISDIIATVGYDGKQVNLPTKGNPVILAIMKSCLELDIHARPTFKQIVGQLQQRNKGMVSSLKKGKTFL